MRLISIGLATVILASGCAQEMRDTGVLQASEDVPEIGVMDWPELRRYCTFHAGGHDFDAGDESTWEFVFVRSNTPSRRDAWGVATLDGERQILDEVSRRVTSSTDSRRYASMDNPEVELLVNLNSAGGGSYTGTVQIVAPERGPELALSGECRS